MAKLFKNPNIFEIGDLRLDIPPEDISWSRFQNHETIDWLRSEGSMKVPTGRTAMRIDVLARFPIGEIHEDLSTLKRLVAMCRTAPFVPVRNKYLFDHLPLLGREGNQTLASEFSGDSIPMAIYGMSIMVGGDSPELVEVRMTLMYWNPAPFMGIEALTWSSRASSEIVAEYGRYLDHIDKVLNDSNHPILIPGDPRTTRITWFELASYNQLKQRFGVRRHYELPEGTNVNDLPSSQRAELWRDRIAAQNTAFLNDPEELARAIADAESRTAAADVSADIEARGIFDPGEYCIRRYCERARVGNTKRDKAIKEWTSGSDISDRGIRVYLTKVYRVGFNQTKPGNRDLNHPRPKSPPVSLDPSTRRVEEGFKGTVDPRDEKLFKDGTNQEPGGWLKVDPNEIQSLDPMFRQLGTPNTINLTPVGLRNTDNQVVTGLTITFQNKFSLIPVQGYPYPALQHLGARDSEVMFSVACMSPSETYPAVKGVMQMLHDMSKRTIDFRGRIYSGRQMHALTEMRVENKVLNHLGLVNFIMTGVDLNRDEESPELVRMTLTLTENNIVDEEFRGQLNYSDQGYSNSLFDFVMSEQWTETTGNTPGVRGPLTTITRLWRIAEDAHRRNAIAIEKNQDRVRLGLESLTVPSEFNQASVRNEFADLFVEGPFTYPKAENGEVLTRAFKHVPMLSSWPLSEIDPEKSVFNLFYKAEAGKATNLPVRIEGDALLGASFANTILQGLNWWVGNLSDDDATIGQYTDAMSHLYLSTRFGNDLRAAAINLVRAQQEFDKRSLNPDDETVQMVHEYARAYLNAWNDCHLEWYKEHQLKRVIYQLAQNFPNVFEPAMVAYQESTGAKRGTYRDLFLGDRIDTNPYDWLDAAAIGTLKESVDGFADRTIEYAQRVKDFAKHYRDVENRITDEHIDKSQITDIDHPDTEDGQKLADNARRGTLSYFDQSRLFDTRTAEDVIAGIRDISTYQFTVRRCFPTFRLYFVEKDNRGAIKSFDEFYNYNAVINWSLHEHTNRPATLVLTLSNIFNHLDNIIIDESIKGDERDQLERMSKNYGQLPLEQNEINGQNQERVGGVTRDIQNIMLKPGAQIMLKAGFDNNPERMETVFSGQVTDVTPGNVMTVVCQDWTSELLSIWDPDYGKSPVAKIGWFQSLVTDDETDILGTKTTRLMIKAILNQLSSRHLGAWQVGNANPFVIYSNSWVRWHVSKKLMRQGYASGGNHMTNIRPTAMPFYSVFGTNTEIAPINYKGRMNWEIIQELRLRHCNNITFVRPFGGAEGTLYFGPPWGTYVSTDATMKRDLRLQGMVKQRSFEAFKAIVRDSVPVSLAGVSYDPVAGRADWNEDVTWFGRAWTGVKARFAPQSVSGFARIPIYAIISHPKVSYELFRATGREDEYFDRVERVIGRNERDNVAVTQLGDEPLLSPGSPEEAIKIWHDALTDQGYIQTGSDRWGPASESAIELLRYVHETIHQYVRREILLDSDRRLDEGDQSEQERQLEQIFNEEIKEVLRPVRKWHIVTSKHHIIANNMTANSNYFNAIGIPGEEDKPVYVQFDPGLDDRRVKYARELADVSRKQIKGFMAASLLRDEMRKMYRGEIILTGNPEIRPHDILVISDDIRQIFGIVEVDKVIHSMDTQNGFISVVTPALVCEVGDLTIAHAYQAFYSQLSSDLLQLQDRGALGKVIASVQSLKFRPFSFGSVDSATSDMVDGAADPDSNLGLQSMAVGSTATAGGVAMFGAGIAGGAGYGGAVLAGTATLAGITAPLALLIGGGLLVGAGLAYFSMQNSALEEYVRQHPVTITPVTKRGWPWMAGIDGAAGRTMVGQWGLDAVKGWDKVQDTLNVLRRAQILATDSLDLYNNFREETGTTGFENSLVN